MTQHLGGGGALLRVDGQHVVDGRLCSVTDFCPLRLWKGVEVIGAAVAQSWSCGGMAVRGESARRVERALPMALPRGHLDRGNGIRDGRRRDVEIVEREGACEEDVEHHTRAPDIDLGVVRGRIRGAAEDLLRGAVEG